MQRVVDLVYNGGNSAAARIRSGSGNGGAAATTLMHVGPAPDGLRGCCCYRPSAEEMLSSGVQLGDEGTAEWATICRAV